MAMISFNNKTKIGKYAFYIIWIPCLLLAVLVSTNSSGNTIIWIISQMIALGVAYVLSRIVDNIAYLKQKNYQNNSVRKDNQNEEIANPEMVKVAKKVRNKYFLFKQIYYELLKLYDHLVVSEIIEDKQKVNTLIEFLFFYYSVFLCVNEIKPSTSDQFLYTTAVNMNAIYKEDLNLDESKFAELFEILKIRNIDYAQILHENVPKEECFLLLLKYIKSVMAGLRKDQQFIEELIKWQEPILNKIIEHKQFSLF